MTAQGIKCGVRAVTFYEHIGTPASSTSRPGTVCLFVQRKTIASPRFTIASLLLYYRFTIASQQRPAHLLPINRQSCEAPRSAAQLPHRSLHHCFRAASCPPNANQSPIVRSTPTGSAAASPIASPLLYYRFTIASHQRCPTIALRYNRPK
jgi:hypothetical protein